jgi:prevent-host-death family protein
MREIGVRELKRSLSETLRAVGRGEQVRVTVRGRPVADIVPAGAAAGDDRLRELVAEGRVVPPARARPRRAPKLARARRSASSLVLSERDAER